MNRTERLFAIAEALRARRTGVTAEELAERFDVSVRTIYRDLDSLRDADLPLISERGRGGGYALARSYNLPPVNFDAREAAVLVSAADVILRLRLLPFTKTLKGATDKVRAALPPPLQRDLKARLASIQSTGVPARAPSKAVGRVVEDAWLEGRPIRITYEGASGTTTRTIRIESIIMERSMTLLNCRDLDKCADRQFRLHSIVAATLVER